MNKPAAITGTYADLKFIKTRSVAQMVIEVPIEHGDALVDMFGTPRPDREVHVAVARLVPEPASPSAESREAPAKRHFTDLPRSQQAALACQREAFQRFIAETGRAFEISEAAAAVFVRQRCHVGSRSELDADPEAAVIWDDLYSRFEAWLAVSA